MATQRKIGATIQLDGEKQFRSAVTQCTSALKTMSSEMKLLDAQYAGQANTLEALTAKHELLDKQLKQSQEIETKTAEALANAQSNYKKAGDSLAVYRDNLAKAEKELEELRKSGTATDDVIEEQEQKVKDLARAVTAGERAYDKAGQNVEGWSQKLNNAKIDTINLSREIEENDKLMKEASQSADGCAHSIDGYGKKIKETAKDTAEGVQTMTEHMDAFFTVDKIRDFANAVSDSFQQVATSAYDAAQTIDKGYDAIIKKSGATGEELLQMKDIADNLYTDMPVDMEKIGDAIGEVSTRFHLQGEELEKVSKTAVQFAELNKTDVVNSIDSAQNMMAAFGQSIKDVDKAYDVMNATGQKTGVNLSTIASKVTENAAAFQELGMDVYQSIDFMGKLETSGADASTVLSGMKRALKSATEDGLSFDEAMADMEDRIKNGTDSMDGLNAAYDLFGKSGAGIYTAVKNGTLSFRDLADSQKLVAESAGSVANTYEKTIDAWDEVTKAQHAFQEAGAELAGEVLKEVTPLIQDFAGGVKDLTKWFKQLPGPTKTVVGLISGVGVAAGVALPKVVSLYTTFRAFRLAGNLPKQFNDITSSINDLTNAGKGAKAIGDVAEAVDSVADASKGASAIGDVADSVDDISDAVKGASGVGELAGDVGELATAGTKASGAFSGFGSAVSASLPYIAGIAGVAVAGYTALQILADKTMKADKEFQSFIKDMDEAEDKITASTDNLNTTFSSTQENLDNIFIRKTSADTLISDLSSLQSKSHLTDEELSQMKSLVSQLNAIFPEMGLSVDEATGQIQAHGKVVKDVSSIYNNMIKSSAESAYQTALADQFTALAEAKLEAKTASEELEKKQKEYDTWKEKRKKEIRVGGLTIGGPFIGGADTNHYTVAERKEAAAMEKELKELSDAEKEHNKTLKEKQDLYNDLQENGLNGYLESLGIATDNTNENTSAVSKSESAYEKLAKKIREAGGALSDEDFAEDEADLQDLYKKTIDAWQDYHDEFTSGLSNEVKSLGDAMDKWSDYHDSVSNALKDNASMFNDVNHNEDITWDSMTQALDNNVAAYEQWNKDVDSILKSTRYAEDEEFREMANSIMKMGIDGADYLRQFVDNIDSSVDLGIGDLARFGELGGVQEQYATTMANLQIATENGMDGIATAFDDTASRAELSLQSLSASLEEQAQQYTDWYENVQKLTESDRYQSDASFREFANNVLSYGTAGADMLDTIVQAMYEGSTDLDDAVADYMSLKGADEKAAQAEASIKATLQDGFDQQVQVVSDAGGQLQNAFANDAEMAKEGFKIDLVGIMNGELTEAEKAIQDDTGMADATTQMTDSMKTSVTSGVSSMLDEARLMFYNFTQEAFGFGIDVGQMFSDGVASSIKTSKNATPHSDGISKTNGDNTTNITMNVTGSDGQDVQDLANIVLGKIQSGIKQGVANYGY